MTLPAVVLYLRADNRALVCIAPPGTSMPPAMIANTIQMTVDRETWDGYDAVRQALPAGQDLVVNADGSTSSTAHIAGQLEQGLTVLSNYLQNAGPTAPETVQALKVLIRVVRGLLT
jgi:hypothetical protein